MTNLEKIVTLIVADAREYGEPPQVRIRADDNDVVRKLPDEFGPIADNLEAMRLTHMHAPRFEGRLGYLRQEANAETMAENAARAFVDALEGIGLTATASGKRQRQSEDSADMMTRITVTLQIAAPDAPNEAAE